jgi:cytoskeletal protein CcmA (bactofilin family)
MAFGSDKKTGTGDSREYGPGDSSSGSFFGKTMRIEGEIISDEDLTIEGKVNGQLEVSKTLTIGRDGYVNGEISANVVRISGEAEGRICASAKLEISSRGKYNGNIQADKIVVAEGAVIKGTINLEEERAKTEEMAKPAKITDQEAQPQQPQQPGPPERPEEEKEIPPAAGTPGSKQK